LEEDRYVGRQKERKKGGKKKRREKRRKEDMGNNNKKLSRLSSTSTTNKGDKSDALGIDGFLWGYVREWGPGGCWGKAHVPINFC
jgi:hypothetical protein